ncbi:hypothetical protein CMV_003958 [Castanea mollissima]|uniref:Uncharacterized protein n=1 Tax=Castanea mollissima TaxID=60419 RepID=A0A8J4RSC8_9ROSI|nr:hypothetical protein CMV_003958 [Castanea mollissima]
MSLTNFDTRHLSFDMTVLVTLYFHHSSGERDRVGSEKLKRETVGLEILSFFLIKEFKSSSLSVVTIPSSSSSPIRVKQKSN